MRTRTLLLATVVAACGDAGAGDDATPAEFRVGEGEPQCPEGTRWADGECHPSQGEGEGEGEASLTPCERRWQAVYGPGGALERIGRPSCDEAVGGPAWPEGQEMFEQRPGFDAELDALDLTELPEAIDMSGLNTLELGYVGYALEEPTCEVQPDPDPTCVSAVHPVLDREATRAKGALGRVVLGALLRGLRADPPEAFDFVFMRRGLHRYYACTRRIPTDLETFRREIFDYTTQEGRVIDSFPKVAQRRMRADSCLGVYVGEALMEGEVTDTEILMTKTRSDGALDFLAYDPTGHLVDRGEFATAGGPPVMAAAPYVCTSCHLNRTVRPNRFDVQFPLMAVDVD